MAKAWRLGAVIAIGLAIGLGVYRGLTPPPIQPGADQEETVEAGLTLRDVTLQQPDENGVLLWRLQAETVTYSPDRKMAMVTRPVSQLFQDGEVIYNVTADQGEILANGDRVFLRGNIVATGVKNGSVLRGQELEWLPQEDVLIMRRQITGTHPQMRATAAEARVYNRQRRMELKGQVVASTVVKDPKTEPWLKLQADQLVWLWEQQQIQSDSPLRVEQLKDKTITAVVTGRRGRVDLAKSVVTLQEAVTMDMLELPLQLISTAMEWRVGEQRVVVNQPLTVVHPKEKVRVTARQGQMDLKTQVVILQGQVVALGERNQSRLTTDHLTWRVKEQSLTALGQVRYQQANPRLNLTGQRGTGQLQDQTFRVDGGPVVTEIQPN
ncbi:MAG: LPS export ABC transporter periplasmic protein LptC [Cyanobacteriota bacterium]|nr:LPS export ABC transporter periplasmic protein LptC [Cyanobacteriota bacterium]